MGGLFPGDNDGLVPADLAVSDLVGAIEFHLIGEFSRGQLVAFDEGQLGVDPAFGVGVFFLEGGHD